MPKYKSEKEREWNVKFGKRLQKVREALGLTVTNAEMVLGFQRDALGRMERGQTTPNAYRLRRISKVYGVSAGYLLGAMKLDGKNLETVANSDDAISALRVLLERTRSQIIAGKVGWDGLNRGYGVKNRKPLCKVCQEKYVVFFGVDFCSGKCAKKFLAEQEVKVIEDKIEQKEEVIKVKGKGNKLEKAGLDGVKVNKKYVWEEN